MNLRQLIDRLIWDLMGVHQFVDNPRDYNGVIVEPYNPTIHKFKFTKVDEVEYNNNRFYLKLVYYNKRTYSSTGRPLMFSIIIVDKMEGRTYVLLHVDQMMNLLHHALVLYNREGDVESNLLNEKYERLKYKPKLLFRTCSVLEGSK